MNTSDMPPRGARRRSLGATRPPQARRHACYNNIGVEGAKAIAAVLKDSQLSTLGCAATPNLHSPFTRPDEHFSLGSQAR